MKGTKENATNLDKNLQKYMDRLWGFSNDENTTSNKPSIKKDKVRKDTQTEIKKVEYNKKTTTNDFKNNKKGNNFFDKATSKEGTNDYYCKSPKVIKKNDHNKGFKYKNNFNVTSTKKEKNVLSFNAYQKTKNMVAYDSNQRSSKKNKNDKNGNKRKQLEKPNPNPNLNKFNESNKKEAFKEKMEQKKIFMDTVHEIRKLSLPYLNIFQRKMVENYQIKTLGGKFEKSRKIHYPELMHRKKSTKKYISKRNEQEKILGVKIQSCDYSDIQDIYRKKNKQKQKKLKAKNLF